MYLISDVDRATAENAWRDVGLPISTFILTNRENGHSHVFWELSIPVSMLPVESATRFYRAIAEGYTNRLDATSESERRAAVRFVSIAGRLRCGGRADLRHDIVQTLARKSTFR